MAIPKLPIADVRGQVTEEGLRMPLGATISRVWITGVIVQKKQENYLSFLVDDGTGTMRVRVFNDLERFPVEVGDTVEVVGRVREYNGRLYVTPDFVRKIDPNTELLRRAEAVKVRRLIAGGKLSLEPPKPSEQPGGAPVENPQSGQETKQTSIDADGKVLETLGDAELTMVELEKKTGLSESELNSCLEGLLENGEVFEPKPGRFKRI